MDLTGLLLFSISVFMLGLYQTTPLADMRPGALWVRSVVGDMLGSILGIVDSHRGPEHVSTSSIQGFNPLAVPVPHTPPPTCPVQPLTLASTPIPARIKSTSIPVDAGIPRESTNSAPEEGLLQDLRSWFQEVFETIILFGKSNLPNARDFALAVCFTLCSAALLGVVGATFMIVYVAYTACKRSAAEFVRKAQLVSADVDQLAAEAQRLRTLLREKMNDIAETIAAEQMAVSQRLSKLRNDLNDAAVRARGATDTLHHAVAEIQDQYAPFPTRDELLATDLQTYRASLDEAAEELSAEMTAVKSMIPDFWRDFESAASTLRRNELEGTLRKKLGEERKKLRRAVGSLREANEGLPDLMALAGEAEQTREDVRGLQESLSAAVKESQTVLRGVPQLQEHLGQAQADILQLKDDVSISRLTYARHSNTTEGAPNPCSPIVRCGENEISLLDADLDPPNQVEAEAAMENLPDISPELEDELLLLLSDPGGDAGNGDSGVEKEPEEGDGSLSPSEEETSSNGSFGSRGIPPELERNMLYSFSDEEDEQEEQEKQAEEEAGEAASSSRDTDEASLRRPRLMSRGRQPMRWEEMAAEEAK